VGQEVERVQLHLRYLHAPQPLLVLVQGASDVLHAAHSGRLRRERESEVEHIVGALVGVEDVVREDVEGAVADLRA
jgi:hypothetical protein